MKIPSTRMAAGFLLLAALCPAVYAAEADTASPGPSQIEPDGHEGHDHESAAAGSVSRSDVGDSGHGGSELHTDEHDHDVEAAADLHGEDAYDDHGDAALQLEPDVMREFDIVVEAAAPGRLDLRTTLPGEVQINLDRTAHIVPRYPGLVIEVRKTIGDQVRKGDVLAVLEGNESLAPYELKSLIDGIIIEKHITLGESLKEDDVVFTITDLDTVWIDLTVYQKDISAIQPNQAVHISGGEHVATAEGRVSYVSPTVDEHTRTGHARVVLPNPDGAWKPGLFVTGDVLLGSVKGSIVVPRTALQTLEGSVVVFVQTREGFEARHVTVGQSVRDRVEILSGLHAGDRYVSRGGFTIKAELARGELEHAGHAH